MSKGTILSGMRPTGRLHIGHLSVLENWARMQEEYECYYMVADLHSLTTKFDETENLPQDIREMVLDWLGAGVDPVKNAIFVQSAVKEHAELHLYLSMNVPLSWLERCPTYKDQVAQFGQQGKDITTYGFLGYPVLMAADILLYLSDTVPVGEDQLPHLEITREMARRFNHLYNTDLFPEPKALLGKFALVPGVDGRKMSKSYSNDIKISATTDEVKKRVNGMVTDPARIRKDDPGHPEVCIAHKYQEIYNNRNLAMVQKTCRNAERGCVACKNELLAVVEDLLKPIRERRAFYEQKGYQPLKNFLQAWKEVNGSIQEDGPRTEEQIIAEFKKFNGHRKEKNYLREIGPEIIADYLKGVISMEEVKNILDSKLDLVNLILLKGGQKARIKAQATINRVRNVMNLKY